MGLSKKHSETLPFLQKLSVWATGDVHQHALPVHLRPLKSIINKSTYSRHGRSEIPVWDSPRVHPKIIEAAQRIDNRIINLCHNFEDN